MRFPPATGLISESDAIAALNAGLAEKPSGINRESREKWAPAPKRSRRGLSVVGAAAAAVMCIGGFGAVVSGAGPGDSLSTVCAQCFSVRRSRSVTTRSHWLPAPN
jgi:hypothetical protein